MPDLTTLGWDDSFAEQFETYADDGLIPGRVAVQHRGAYDVLTEPGVLRCDVAGRLYEESRSPADLPAVGDWVAVAARAEEDAGTIQAVLPRRTRFSRKTAWQAAEEQVLAANVDVVFIVTSLNEDLSLRRLERYLSLARESGAQPVVLLTKSDLGHTGRVPDEGGRRDARDRFLPAAPRAARRLNSETGLSRRARRHAP